jgi:hypothetical protein
VKVKNKRGVPFHRRCLSRASASDVVDATFHTQPLTQLTRRPPSSHFFRYITSCRHYEFQYSHRVPNTNFSSLIQIQRYIYTNSHERARTRHTILRSDLSPFPLQCSRTRRCWKASCIECKPWTTEAFMTVTESAAVVTECQQAIANDTRAHRHFTIAHPHHVITAFPHAIITCPSTTHLALRHRDSSSSRARSSRSSSSTRCASVCCAVCSCARDVRVTQPNTHTPPPTPPPRAPTCAAATVGAVNRFVMSNCVSKSRALSGGV